MCVCVCVCVCVRAVLSYCCCRALPQLTRKLLLFGVAVVGPHAYEWIYNARRAWGNLSFSLSLSLSLSRGRFFVVVVTHQLCISINALLRYQGFPFPITIFFRRRQSHLSPALSPLILLLLRCCKCAIVRIFAFVCVCSSGVDAGGNERVLFSCFFFCWFCGMNFDALVLRLVLSKDEAFSLCVAAVY